MKTYVEALAAIRTLEEGSRLRMAAPDGEVGEEADTVAVLTPDGDGMKVVIRQWSEEKARWRYDVIGVEAFMVGLWRPDA